jgi:hypothetical protein
MEAVKNAYRNYGTGRSGVVNDRDPSMEERAAAGRLSKSIERVAVGGVRRSRVRQVQATDMMRTNLLAARRGQIASGQDVTVKAFVKRRQSVVPKTEVKVGICIDHSGSMQQVANQAAALRWILTEATRRIRGQVAATCFSRRVFGLQLPNEHTNKITQFSMVAGRHRCADALLLLDDALDLIDSDGARVLVLFSDGAFESGQKEDANTVMQEFTDAGVTTILVTPYETFQEVPDGWHYMMAAVNCTVFMGNRSSEQITEDIGKAILEAVQQVRRTQVIAASR